MFAIHVLSFVKPAPPWFCLTTIVLSPREGTSRTLVAPFGIGSVYHCNFTLDISNWTSRYLELNLRPPHKIFLPGVFSQFIPQYLALTPIDYFRYIKIQLIQRGLVDAKKGNKQTCLFSRPFPSSKNHHSQKPGQVQNLSCESEILSYLSTWSC